MSPADTFARTVNRIASSRYRCRSSKETKVVRIISVLVQIRLFLTVCFHQNILVQIIPKPAFAWKDAFTALGTPDVLLLVMEHLSNFDLVNSLFVSKHWMQSIKANKNLVSKIAGNFQGLYRNENQMASLSVLGSLKFKETLPFCSFRKILVDWLIDVQSEYKLLSETLHTSVLLVDRCLFHFEDIPSSKLQLLGITCLFLAAKFCEIVHPLLADMVWVCDNTYSRQEHVDMEIKVMLLLNFRVFTVTPAAYISALRVSLKESEQLELLALFLADLALVEGVSVCTPPSLIAAAATALALHTLHKEVPLELIALQCRTTIPHLQKHFCLLQHLQIEDYMAFGPDARPCPPPPAKQPLRAVHDRYSREACGSVSLVPPRRPILERDSAGWSPVPMIRCSWCQSAACANRTMARGSDYDLHGFVGTLNGHCALWQRGMEPHRAAPIALACASLPDPMPW